MDEDEKEGSPTNDMGEIKREDCSGFWHTGKLEREASLSWSAGQERALKEISLIIKEQAQHDEMRKNASEDRSGSPQSLSQEAGGAVGGICPQDDLIHLQEMEFSPPVKKQEPVPSWHPLVTDQARNGGISQPTEEDCRQGLGDIKTELDQRDQYLMGKMRADFYDMLEEHQWKTTNTFTKLEGKVGDLGGKVIQLSQAVEETRGRMDKTLEAVQVALREITGIKDQMATWLFQEEVKGIQDFQRTPMRKGSPTDSFRRDLSHGEYEDSGRSSDRRPRRDNTRMAIPQRPGAGRGLQGSMGKVFPVSRQGGVVPESARSPKTGREIGPIVGEVLGIDLPLQSRTTPKEEEGGIGIPKSIYRIWNFTLEGNHGEIITLSFVATGR